MYHWRTFHWYKNNAESVSVYVHDFLIRLNKDTHENVVLHHFVTGLPTDTSAQLRAPGDAELHDVIEQAIPLMSISPLAPVPGCELRPW